MKSIAIPFALCAVGCIAAASSPAIADQNQSSRSDRHYHIAAHAIKSPTPLMALGSQDYQSNTSTTIALAGKDIMRVRSGAAGYTAQQRAEAIRLRLIPIQSMSDLSASDVHVTELPQGDQAITVRGNLLVTVDHELAAQNNVSRMELANTWADNLRDALPDTKVSPPSTIVAP